jgi:pimeloyl-ACP methyl ester carboxylesterase
MGGMISQIVAAKYPEKVEKIGFYLPVIINPFYHHRFQNNFLA